LHALKVFRALLSHKVSEHSSISRRVLNHSHRASECAVPSWYSTHQDRGTAERERERERDTRQRERERERERAREQEREDA
jgi:hypothetical protein